MRSWVTRNSGVRPRTAERERDEHGRRARTFSPDAHAAGRKCTIALRRRADSRTGQTSKQLRAIFRPPLPSYTCNSRGKVPLKTHSRKLLNRPSRWDFTNRFASRSMELLPALRPFKGPITATTATTVPTDWDSVPPQERGNLTNSIANVKFPHLEYRRHSSGDFKGCHLPAKVGKVVVRDAQLAASDGRGERS